MQHYLKMQKMKTAIKREPMDTPYPTVYINFTMAKYSVFHSKMENIKFRNHFIGMSILKLIIFMFGAVEKITHFTFHSKAVS